MKIRDTLTVQAAIYNDEISDATEKTEKFMGEKEATKKAKQVPSSASRAVGLSGGGPGSGRHSEGKFEQIHRKTYSGLGTHTKYVKGNKIVVVQHGSTPGRASVNYPLSHGTSTDRNGTHAEIGSFLKSKFGINHDFGSK